MAGTVMSFNTQGKSNKADSEVESNGSCFKAFKSTGFAGLLVGVAGDDAAAAFRTALAEVQVFFTPTLKLRQVV